MKKGWIAVGLLVAMAALAGWNVSALNTLTGELSAKLERAEALAERGDWDQALELTMEARDRWESKRVYLHVTLDHAITDQITADFAETLELLECQETGEYSAASAQLKTQLELLGEGELPTWENLL